MKKIIHRDVFGANPRKREVSVEETIDRIGATIHKRRSSKYYIEEKMTSTDVKELEKWIEEHKSRGLKKNCHVFRELNTSTGVNKVVCKVMGEFFAVWGETAVKILYVNEIKLELDSNKVKSE
jgi:5'(3')-deoxyribonucleotidase